MTTTIKNPIGRIPEGFNMVADDEYERQWQFDDLDQEFVSDSTGDWMTLTVTTGFAECEKVQIDGMVLCKDYGREYTFVCRYALGEQEVSDTLTVSGSDYVEKAESHGTLAYTLQGGLHACKIFMSGLCHPTAQKSARASISATRQRWKWFQSIPA